MSVVECTQSDVTLTVVPVLMCNFFVVCIYLTALPQVKGFKDYVELYVKGDLSQTEEELPRKVVYEAVNPRWEVAVTASNHGFQQASFVNSIATAKVVQHMLRVAVRI